MSDQAQSGTPRRRLLSFALTLWQMQPQRSLFAMLGIFGGGLLGGCGVLLLVPLLEALNQTAVAEMHGLSRLLSDAFAGCGIRFELLPVMTVFLVIACGNAWLRRELTISNACLRLHFSHQLQNRMFHAIAAVRWSYFIRERRSDFVHVLTRDLNRVSQGTLSLLNLMSAAVLVTIHLALAVVISPTLTVVVICAGLMLTPLLIRLNRRVSEAGRQLTGRSHEFYHCVEQQLSGMKEIKSLGATSRQVDTFQDLTQAMHDSELAFNRATANSGLLFAAGSALLLSGLLVMSVELLTIPLTDLMLVVVLFGRLAPQFRALHSQYQGLLHVLSSFEAVTDMQARLSQEAEQPGAEKFEQHSARVTTASNSAATGCGIELKNVSFRYETSAEQAAYPAAASIQPSPHKQQSEWALQKVDLVIPPHQTTALVGPSGSGKSTLADLLLGLLQPTAGEILIDGTRLNAEVLPRWRRRVGYVPQETFLLHASVRANLLLANPHADESLMLETLDAAAADFVRQLPQGLDTIIADRGVRLSGGERQRIALARALLRKPEVLILDEATSSLDAHNQDRILRAIERMHGRLTVVMIAHRLSTVRHADRVVVLQQGQIQEAGAYSELAGNESSLFRSCLNPDSRAA